MKKAIYAVIAIILSANLSHAQCTPAASKIYTFTTNGIKYEIIKENLNWSDAAACAVTRGGRLAEIKSQKEQDSIFSYVNKAGITASSTIAPDGGGASYLWLGGNDVTTEGKWIWDGDNNGAGVQFWQGDFSGTPIGGLYNNWGSEPDDYTGQDALGFAFTSWPLGIKGEWNDVKASNLLYYIIEYIPTSGIKENRQEKSFLIYPNPASDKITVALSSANDYFVEISNLLGQVIIKSKSENSIDIAHLNSGVYLVTVIQGESRFTQKLIKQ